MLVVGGIVAVAIGLFIWGRPRADIVALSFSAHHAATDVKQALTQLRSQLPAATELWVGGSAPVLHQRLAPPHCVVLHQASDVPEQVQRWRAALTG